MSHQSLLIELSVSCTVLYCALLNRNTFLVNGDGRTFSWEFMSDLLEEMSRHRAVQNANDIDIRNRYPPAGAVFNEASTAYSLYHTRNVRNGITK